MACSSCGKGATDNQFYEVLDPSGNVVTEVQGHFAAKVEAFKRFGATGRTRPKQ
jgi:hypothetical protein